jgi:hypothetical protein
MISVVLRLLNHILSLNTDNNVPKERNKQKTEKKYLFFVDILKATTKQRRVRNTAFFIFCYLPFYGMSFSPFVSFLFWSELIFFHLPYCRDQPRQFSPSNRDDF